jgi:hypothetical protein
MDLQPGADCLPLDRLGGPLSPPEAAHLESCARCRTELALFAEFQASGDSPGEGAAVQWIVRELERRGVTAGPASASTAPSAPRGWWGWVSRPFLVPVAAALAVLVAYAAWDREPAVRDIQSPSPVYRTIELVAIDPVGEKASAPTTFVWDRVEGVVHYDLRLFEVDGTTLWQTSAVETHVSPPSTITRQFVPGKTLLWRVTARNAAGVAIAESSTQRFRISP